MNPNRLVAFLEKPASQFTKADILRVIEEFGIEMVNFRYMANDGKLKTLNFVINSYDHIDEVLTSGERVDGSSLFPFCEAGNSDLYVIPRFRTAFIDPFAAIPTLNILCNYYTKDGEPFPMAPEYTLAKAGNAFRKVTGGMEFEVMGELEYYVIAPKDDLYLTPDQKGYHASTPYCKFENYRTEAMQLIAACGGLIKYGHSEVGNFSVGDTMYEQNEIEFLPTTLEDAADQLVIAKWLMRTLAHQYGITVTFAPKITVGKAGSGMHVHCKFTKDGKTATVRGGELTDEARKAIAGFMAAIQTNVCGKQYLDNTQNETAAIRAYTTTNVNLQYKIPMPDKAPAIRLLCQINNIFNSKYASNGGSDMGYIKQADGSLKGAWPWYMAQAGINVHAGFVVDF